VLVASALGTFDGCTLKYTSAGSHGVRAIAGSDTNLSVLSEISVSTGWHATMRVSGTFNNIRADLGHWLTRPRAKKEPGFFA